MKFDNHVIQGNSCHSERSEESREHKVGVTEIFRTESSTTRLPPCGRLNDNLCQLVYRSQKKLCETPCTLW